MKKILVIGGSNSKESINKKLAVYSSEKVEGVSTIVFDLNDFDLPIFGVDHEKAHGTPNDVIKINDIFDSVDGFIVSLAEHNGSYTVAFKNILDWVSTLGQHVWKNKPMLLMATSPGERGGISVLNAAKDRFPYLGAEIKAEFSLPNFEDNFKAGKIIDPQLEDNLNTQIEKFKSEILN